MSGGMFTISRERFTELVGFDAGMDQWVWDGLEMSFKVRASCLLCILPIKLLY